MALGGGRCATDEPGVGVTDAAATAAEDEDVEK